jgi:metallophosphoesterase (TIGR00282 family)
VDVITSGGHIWDQREIISVLDEDVPILRPLNYPPGVPGKGYLAVGDALVVNLMGRVFVGTLDCPFRAMDGLLKHLGSKCPKVVLVDFHAEATSEKAALAWYLDGRVTAVVGTHTHVPTCDHRILPKGTAFVSDLGMVGPVYSIIGNEPADVLARFLTQMPNRLNVPSKGPVNFNSVMVETHDSMGRAARIERVDRVVNL